MLHTEPLTAQAKSYLGLNHEGLEDYAIAILYADMIQLSHLVRVVIRIFIRKVENGI